MLVRSDQTPAATLAPATGFTLEYGRVAGDPTIDPNLTMRMHVDLTIDGPVTGSVFVKTLVGGEVEEDSLPVVDSPLARRARTALVDAMNGVDFLRFGRTMTSGEVPDFAIRLTRHAADGARSIDVAGLDDSIPGVMDLVIMASEFFAAACPDLYDL